MAGRRSTAELDGGVRAPARPRVERRPEPDALAEGVAAAAAARLDCWSVPQPLSAALVMGQLRVLGGVPFGGLQPGECIEVGGALHLASGGRWVALHASGQLATHADNPTMAALIDDGYEPPEKLPRRRLVGFLKVDALARSPHEIVPGHCHARAVGHGQAAPTARLDLLRRGSPHGGHEFPLRMSPAFVERLGIFSKARKPFTTCA